MDEVKKAIKCLAIDFDGARRQYGTVISQDTFGEGISGGIKATFTGLTDKFNVNFTIKHYVALFVCWLWAVYVDNWGGGCVITAVFLMSTAVCPDIQVFLNVLNAVVLAVVLGTMVFQGTCGTGYGNYILPIC